MKSKMQLLFETWIKTQFDINTKTMLVFDFEDGYKNSHINSLWIGFNAGYLLTKR